jgi:hypothetical protein
VPSLAGASALTSSWHPVLILSTLTMVVPIRSHCHNTVPKVPISSTSTVSHVHRKVADLGTQFSQHSRLF